MVPATFIPLTPLSHLIPLPLWCQGTQAAQSGNLCHPADG